MNKSKIEYLLETILYEQQISSKDFISKNFNDINEPEKIKFNEKIFSAIQDYLPKPLNDYVYKVLSDNLSDSDIGLVFTMMRNDDEESKEKISTLFYYLYTEYFNDFIKATAKKNGTITGSKEIDVKVANLIDGIFKSKPFKGQFIKIFLKEKLYIRFTDKLFDAQNNPYITEQDDANNKYLEAVLKSVSFLKPSIQTDIKKDLQKNINNIESIYEKIKGGDSELLSDLSSKHIINHYRKYVFKSQVAVVGKEFITLLISYLTDAKIVENFSKSNEAIFDKAIKDTTFDDSSTDQGEDEDTVMDYPEYDPVGDTPRERIINWSEENRKYVKKNKTLTALYKILKNDEKEEKEEKLATFGQSFAKSVMSSLIKVENPYVQKYNDHLISIENKIRDKEKVTKKDIAKLRAIIEKRNQYENQYNKKITKNKEKVGDVMGKLRYYFREIFKKPY